MIAEELWPATAVYPAVQIELGEVQVETASLKDQVEDLRYAGCRTQVWQAELMSSRCGCLQTSEWTIAWGLLHIYLLRGCFAAGGLTLQPSQCQYRRCRTALQQAAGAQATAVTVLQVRCADRDNAAGAVPWSCSAAGAVPWTRPASC